jgi:hypothetical protein
MKTLAGAVAAIALIAPAPANAATRSQVQALARAAQTSPAALARLRAVRSVGGRPVDLARALDTDDPVELRVRLHALAGTGEPAPRQIRARDEARSILAGRRFRGSTVPRPFHGFLVWLGERLRPVRHAVDWLGQRVPGGNWTVWALLAAAVLAATAVVAGRAARRRGTALLDRGERVRLAGIVDPSELERLADEAEGAGDAATALRLRFRAGLVRLGRARVVPLRESLTTGEARRFVASNDFDVLARTHDEVAYGGRAARTEDAVAAREGWPRVLAAKGVRA